MSGERDLQVLLSHLRPDRRPGCYVFCTVPQVPAGVTPVASVREDEGLSIVVEQAEADRLGLDYELVASLVTLRVHSALDAVGLTAAVAQTLAAAGISCNMVAGRFHDHLFVPVDDAERAVQLLDDLSASAG